MARIRTIKPEFVESESVGKLSREARLLFILLWTILDDEGRSRASSRFLASRLYPYDDDASKKIGGWLAELEKGGHVRLYDVGGDSYLDVPNWLKHQKIDHPSASRLPPFRESSRDLASNGETFAPHTLDLGPVPRTLDLGPSPAAEEIANERRSKLPPDWRPTPDDRDYASDKGLDPETATAAFTDYFGEGRGRAEKRTPAGWSKRFRVWCNTDANRTVDRSRPPQVRPARGNDAVFERLAVIANRGGGSGSDDPGF